MGLSMAHDTDASTSISTCTKNHIVLLNNHLNIKNAMVSLLTLSASCDKKHVIAMYVQKPTMPLKCYI